MTIGSRERKGIAAASVSVAIVRAVVVPDRVLRFRVAALASAVPVPATVAVPTGLDLRRGRICRASDNAPPTDRKWLYVALHRKRHADRTSPANFTS
ncbi:hypothetical protein [Burkholderia dolosa]|uniref:hypothetical protein n=1 Tax=Burkholderia dolosa TaxID=152500 RepID=UPI001C987D56|nr:hypothetical protein [Burkholderia dolosa]MBY4829771.1 hypothetical protein [Burkholderia dolosa]